MPSLIQHEKSTKHCPCPHCDPSDSHEALLEGHLSPIEKYSCPECRKRFAQEASLQAHQRENLHAHCYNCDIFSPTKRLHVIHMKSHGAASSVTQFRCCDCERDFINEGALAHHLSHSKIHKVGNEGKKTKAKKKKQNRKEENNRPTRCTKCVRTFKNQSTMERHLKSVRHNPMSDIKCIADVECKKRFNCPSAQLQHLEAGKCVSGMTKAKLNTAVAANDSGRIIISGGVTAQWLLEDNLSKTSTSQTPSPILTPTSTEFVDSYPSSPILTPISTSTLSTSPNFHSALALRLQHNPQSGFQTCPLCPTSSTRNFKPKALQQHLTSSVHAQVSVPLPLVSPTPVPDEISFHCPRALIGETGTGKADRQFSTVSGLAQHLESGTCDGGKGTLKRVVEYVQEEMKGMGFSGLKLLN